jgi:CRP/FNR family transcriptional regulator, cyclic AMP receptor protein
MPAGPTDRGSFPLLRKTLLSRFLTDEQLGALDGFCRTVSRRAWSSLFRQGEDARTLYVVVDGSVELRARPPGRRLYRTVEVVSAGCTVGDEAALGEARYEMAARALEPSRLLAIDRADLDRLAERHPAVAIGVVKCSGSCLIQTVRRAAILTQAPADVALRQLLEELAADKDARDGRVPVRITHTQLAGVLHVSRETVSRLLSKLSEAGVVEPGRGVLRVRR